MVGPVLLVLATLIVLALMLRDEFKPEPESVKAQRLAIASFQNTLTELEAKYFDEMVANTETHRHGWANPDCPDPYCRVNRKVYINR